MFGSSGFLLVMLVVVVGMFYMMSRRNKKQQKEQGDFRSSLQVGSRVMTIGGVIGVITCIEGDVVTLKSSGGDETQFIKRAIKESLSDEAWESLIMPDMDFDAPDEDEDQAEEAEQSVQDQTNREDDGIDNAPDAGK